MVKRRVMPFGGRSFFINIGYIGLIGLMILMGPMVSAGPHPEVSAAEKRLEVLASTFPIYQITRNVTSGREAVNVALMIPAQLGCPHDYTLTPRDMQQLAKADVLILNGLGMEEYLGAPVKRANSRIRIIDSSSGIKDILRPSDRQEDGNGHHGSETASGNPKKPVHKDGHDPHHHDEANPHLFASPRMVALLAMNIAGALSRIDPDGESLYSENARVYAEKMRSLSDEFAALGRRLVNNRIVTQHGVFDYLARDMGLEIVSVIQAHAGQEPSASEILEIIKTVKREKIGAVFTEPQYPERIGRTIAGEAGIVAATLDPVATGTDTAPLTYYETRMRHNLSVIGKSLGIK